MQIGLNRRIAGRLRLTFARCNSVMRAESPMFRPNSGRNWNQANERKPELENQSHPDHRVRRRFAGHWCECIWRVVGFEAVLLFLFVCAALLAGALARMFCGDDDPSAYGRTMGISNAAISGSRFHGSAADARPLHPDFIRLARSLSLGAACRSSGRQSPAAKTSL